MSSRDCCVCPARALVTGLTTLASFYVTAGDPDSEPSAHTSPLLAEPSLQTGCHVTQAGLELLDPPASVPPMLRCYMLTTIRVFLCNFLPVLFIAGSVAAPLCVSCVCLSRLIPTETFQNKVIWWLSSDCKVPSVRLREHRPVHSIRAECHLSSIFRAAGVHT